MGGTCSGRGLWSVLPSRCVSGSKKETLNSELGRKSAHSHRFEVTRGRGLGFGREDELGSWLGVRVRVETHPPTYVRVHTPSASSSPPPSPAHLLSLSYRGHLCTLLVRCFPPSLCLHTSSLSLIGGRCAPSLSASSSLTLPAHLLSLSYRGHLCTLPVRFFLPPLLLACTRPLSLL